MKNIRQVFGITMQSLKRQRKNSQIILTFVLAFVLCLMLTDKAVSFCRQLSYKYAGSRSICMGVWRCRFDYDLQSASGTFISGCSPDRRIYTLLFISNEQKNMDSRPDSICTTFNLSIHTVSFCQLPALSVPLFLL